MTVNPASSTDTGSNDFPPTSDHSALLWAIVAACALTVCTAALLLRKEKH